MTTIARLLLATALVFGCGCAKQDWIDRTLVTVDVFRFRSARGDVEGELTVINGDEMNGRCSISGGSRQVSLRRIEPSSPPASPPR